MQNNILSYALLVLYFKLNPYFFFLNKHGSTRKWSTLLASSGNKDKLVLSQATQKEPQHLIQGHILTYLLSLWILFAGPHDTCNREHQIEGTRDLPTPHLGKTGCYVSTFPRPTLQLLPHQLPSFYEGIPEITFFQHFEHVCIRIFPYLVRDNRKWRYATGTLFAKHKVTSSW